MEFNYLFDKPGKKLETSLIKIWEKYLGRHPLRVTDDFYEMGGHSLVALQISSEIEANFGVSVPLAVFAQARTIEDLVYFLKKKGLSNYIVPLQPKGTNPPFFCVPPSVATGMIFKDLAKHMGEDQPFYGLNYSGMDLETEPHRSVEDIADKNISEIQVIQPEGPYFLGGMCFGGMVAFEMAQQLLALGREVAYLGILDSSFAPKQKKTVFTQVLLLVSFINEHLMRGKIPLTPKYLRGRIEKLEMDPEHKKRLIKLSDLHTYARIKYVSAPYPGKITLFSTERQIANKSRAMWQMATLTDLEIVTIPGVHEGRKRGENGSRYPFISEPNVQILAQKMKVTLESAGLRP